MFSPDKCAKSFPSIDDIPDTGLRKMPGKGKKG
jgi:hypothetical protein